MFRVISLSCNLSALSETQRKRHSQLAHFVLSKHSDVKDLVDGYRLEFLSSPDTFLMIAEWVVLERLCCPFISFSLEIDPENQPIRVTLTGPMGTKEVLKASIESAHPSFSRIALKLGLWWVGLRYPFCATAPVGLRAFFCRLSNLRAGKGPKN